jgi:dTDP-4-dehydrorhamnose reductase
MNVLVTGVSGLLGINLSLCLANEYQVFGVYHRRSLSNTPFQTLSADLSNEKELFRMLESTKPDVIINCAAMAIVDRCEENPDAAWKINAEMPGMMAKTAQRMGIQLVHISTDSVFDGIQGGYRESDTPNPLGVYARTKVEGEKRVTNEYPDALIARVNFFGSSLSGSRSLAEWFYYNLLAGKRLSGFTDVFFSPLFVDDLAEILWQMTGLGLSGLYHVVSSECLSKYEFGIRLAREFGLDEKLVSPSSWKDAGLKAARSPNLCLDTTLIRNALGQPMPGQAQGMKRFRQKMDAGFPKRLQRFTENGQFI